MKGRLAQEWLAKFRHSQIARSILKPLYEMYEVNLYKSYSKLEDVQKLAALYGKYAGKRCFVIGNGPSLLPSDLDRLKGEITFGANRIYYIFNQTEWRPTYYISLDPASIALDLDIIKASGNYVKFLNYRVRKYGREKDDNILYLFPQGQYQVNPFDSKVDALSENISQYVSKVNTVTVNSIEIAIYMGFKEIYLLGVDNDYACKVGSNGKIYVDSTVKSTYFAGMKDSFGKEGAGFLAFQDVDSMNYSYALAKNLAQKKAVRIYNATRGGKLETFERINFDSLF